jgi:hypothetical protein
MNCGKCEELNLASTIKRSSEGWITTAYRRPFEDDEGREHNHKVEVTTIMHWCSNGHCFKSKKHTECWCGWPINKEFE